MNSSFPLSEKYIDFIRSTNVDADFMEGTTASGKTTVGASVKFMLMVSRSKKKLHVIASKTTGTAEKNILQQDNGILDIHRNAKYYGNGDTSYKIPHIKFEGKIIFILGYDNRDKWSLVLGSQFGCVYIDEINTANIDFVREVSTRNEYLMATLNPDNPELPVYKEFINRARPYKKYAADVPPEIMAELNKAEPNPKWRYWFFSFADNLALTEAEITKKRLSAPKGTKLYKNKILGLRGKCTGLVFPNFDRSRHVVSADYARGLIQDKRRKDQMEYFVLFSVGCDTAYSQTSPDTIAMSFCGLTNKGRWGVLEERVYNNATLQTPIAPSDTARNLTDFAMRCADKYGLSRNAFIDSADQATITECTKYKREHGSVLNYVPAWKQTKIIDRINLQLGWFAHDDFFIVDSCKTYISELEVYSWMEDKDNTPEDSNDHMINSVQYAFLPYKSKIGGNRP